ncbi:hypothetical protein I5677_16755 [Mobilitalea sibirica]|uniref:Uncharacterized protein n=1 Tax=Mobilitalea sibirica TaxID=1462919 RepID=A0A8J7HEK1_9FIRM|nr:hypothetical protein [Mobilitalea sibirica]MBH1942544.1 hypothetical protein [Mobilitalea sibirica]
MNNEELILKMLSEMNTKIDKLDLKANNLENNLKEVKREIKKMQKTDDLILDEVERVHEIFEKKYNELITH